MINLFSLIFAGAAAATANAMVAEINGAVVSALGVDNGSHPPPFFYSFLCNEL